MQQHEDARVSRTSSSDNGSVEQQKTNQGAGIDDGLKQQVTPPLEKHEKNCIPTKVPNAGNINEDSPSCPNEERQEEPIDEEELASSVDLQEQVDFIGADHLGIESASNHLLALFNNYAQNSLALHRRRLYWIVPERSIVQEEDARGMLAFLRGGDNHSPNDEGEPYFAAALLPPQIKHAMLVYDDTESGFEWDDDQSVRVKDPAPSLRPKKWLRAWLPRDRYLDLAHRDTSILYRGQHSSPPIRTLPVPSNRPPPEIVRELAINGTYYQRLLFLTYVDWPSSRDVIQLQQDTSLLEIEAEFVGGMLTYSESQEFDELAYQSLVSHRRAIINNVHSKSKALREKYVPEEVVLEATPVVSTSMVSSEIGVAGGKGMRQTSAGKSSRPGSGRMEELLKIRSKKHTDEDNQRRIDEEENLHNKRISALKGRSIPLHADSIGFSKSGPTASGASRGLLPPLPTSSSKKKPPTLYVSPKHAQHHMGSPDAEKWVSTVSKPSPGTELTFSPVKTAAATPTRAKGINGRTGAVVTSIESKYTTNNAPSTLASSSSLPPLDVSTEAKESTNKTSTIPYSTEVVGKHTQKRIDEIMALPPPPSHAGFNLPLLRPHSGAISQRTVRINDYDYYLTVLRQQEKDTTPPADTTVDSSSNKSPHGADYEEEEDRASISPFPLNVIQLRKKEQLMFIAKKNGIIGNMVDTQGKIAEEEKLRILTQRMVEAENDGDNGQDQVETASRNLPSIWGPLPPDNVPTLSERKNILVASPLRVGDRNLNPLYATTEVHNHLPQSLSSPSPRRKLRYDGETDYVGSTVVKAAVEKTAAPVVPAAVSPSERTGTSSPLSTHSKLPPHHSVINPTTTIDHIDYSPDVHHTPTRDPYTTLKELQLGELRCRGTLRSLYNDSVLTQLNQHFIELSRNVKLLKVKEDQQKAEEKCRAFMELEENRCRENVALFEDETRNGLFKNVLQPKNIRRAQKLIGTHFTKVSQPLLGQYSLWMWGDAMSSFRFGVDVQIPEEAERTRLTRWFKSERSRIIAKVESAENARIEAERELLTRDQDLTKPPTAEAYAASSALLQEQHRNTILRRQEAHESLIREIASIESREHNRREVVEHEFQYSLYTGIGASCLLQQDELVARDHIVRTLYMRDFVEQFMTGFTLKQLALTSVEERVRKDLSERQESLAHDALKSQLQMFHDRHHIELEAMEAMMSERDALSAGVIAGVWNTRIQQRNAVQTATINSTATRVAEMARAKARAAEMERKGLVELRDTGAIRKYGIYASPKSSPSKPKPFSSASFGVAQAAPTISNSSTTIEAVDKPHATVKPSKSIYTQEESEWNRLITSHERFILQLDIAGANREGKASLPSGMRRLERQRVANGERWGY